MAETYTFDEQTQVKLLSLLRQRYIGSDHINPSYFINPILAEFCKALITLQNINNPTPQMVFNEVKHELGEATREYLPDIKKYIKFLFKNISESHVSYYTELASEFAEYVLYRKTVQQSIELLRKNDPRSVKRLKSIWEKVVDTDFKNDTDVGRDYFSTVAERIRRRLETPDVLKTMIPELDGRLSNGGIARGELILFAGSPSTGKCLIGETLIDCPRDLRKYPKGIPIENLVGKTGYVYSWSNEIHQFVLRKATNVRRTGKKQEVWRMVWYDKRKKCYGEIIATPDHPIMLINGRYRKLEDLNSGDNLMCFRRDYTNTAPYATIKVSSSLSGMEHRFVYDQVYGLNGNEDVHHKNGNKIDNSLSNLQHMTKEEHARYHMLKNNPMHNPIHRAKLQGENHPRGMLGKHHSDISKQKIGIGATGRKDSDATKIKRSIAHKGRRITEKMKINLREKALKRYRDPERKAYWLEKNKQGKAHKRGGTWSESRRIAESNKYKIDNDIDNHEVVSVEFYGYEDVYDMEVDGTHNFVANEIVVHNSLALQHIAKAAVFQQKNVVFFSLEMQYDRIEDRLDSAFTGIPMRDLRNQGIEVSRRLKKLSKQFDQRLRLKRFPAYLVKISTLKRFLENLIRNDYIPDMIVTDYINLIAPEHRSANRYEDLGQTYLNLRSLGEEFNVYNLTAAQGNRGSTRTEIFSMADLSQSFEGSAHSDIIVTINRTEEERAQQRARLYLAKNRSDVDSVVLNIYTNFSCGLFYRRRTPSAKEGK